MTDTLKNGTDTTKTDKAFILLRDYDKPHAYRYDYNRVVGLKHLTEKPRIGYEKVFNIGDGHRLIIANVAGSIRVNLHVDVCALSDAKQALKKFLQDRGFGKLIIGGKAI